MRFSPPDKAVARDALKFSADFLGNTPTGYVFDNRDDFEPRKPKLGETKMGRHFYSNGGDTSSGVGRRNPVADIAKVVIVVDLVYINAANHFIRVGFENQKWVRRAL